MAGNATVDTVAKWLVVVGGLNWGLQGLGSFVKTDLNVVHRVLALAGSMGGTLENVVYVLVGLAAAYTLLGMFKK